MHLRIALLQPANQIEIKLERQIRMQSADDVEFRGAFGHASPRARCKFHPSEKVYAPGESGERPKAQSLQCATQTFVGLMCRLTLK